MQLHGHIVTAPDGVRGLDTTEHLEPNDIATFYDFGFRFCLRYVRRDPNDTSDISAQEAEDILGGGLGLMIVQRVESETSWTPTADKGSKYGDAAQVLCGLSGIPAGVTVWCDLEAVAVGTPVTQVEDYCNNWHSAVAAAGYHPGLYVGEACGLNATQLYRNLRFTDYWSAYNLNSDEYPAVRGVQMRQLPSAPKPPSIKYLIHVDMVQTDALGARPRLLAPEGWPG